MQILLQSVQNRRRGLGCITRSRFPGDRPTDTWIQRRHVQKEILFKTTQQMNHLSEFLIHLLIYPVPGLSRGL